MATLILYFPDRPAKVVDCPSGSDPISIAEQHGTDHFDYRESRAEANYVIESDPNRKLEWV